MTIRLSEFISQLIRNPALAVTVVFSVGGLLVNGGAGAPHARAPRVDTPAIRPKHAILMAAIFNFFGVLLMTAINSTVA